MYSIEELDNLQLETLSDKEVQKIFSWLVKENKLNEIKHIIKNPEIKAKIQIEQLFGQLCLFKNYTILDYILFSDDFKPESNLIENKEFAFECICAAGNLTGAYSFYKRMEIKEENLNQGLELACIFGHLDIVKFVLNQEYINKKADIHYENDIAILKACKHGHIEIVKYLLESPELKHHSNIHIEVNEIKDYPFMLAAEYSQNEVVKYLLSLKNKNKPNIKTGEFGVVKEYLLNGNLEMLKHIIETEKINIHLDDDYLFKFAYHRKHTHILRYLILELGIKKTKKIKQYLLENPDQEIEELFNKRKLNQTLLNKFNQTYQKKNNIKNKI